VIGGDRNDKERSMRKIGYVVFAAGLVLAATATDALAGFAAAVPEISPTSLSAGLALLAGGVLIARARRRK
jgi:uncharacterized membrane protein YdfJ with MMPL/SSD domain